MWHGGRRTAVVWCDSGRTPAMSHGSGRTAVVVGVQQQLRCVAVAAWHGGSRWSHGLVMVAVVVSWWLRHGCGGSGSGHTTAAIAVTLRHNGSVAWQWWLVLSRLRAKVPKKASDPFSYAIFGTFALSRDNTSGGHAVVAAAAACHTMVQLRGGW